MSFRWIGMSEDGNTVTLKKLSTQSLKEPNYLSENWIVKNSNLIRKAVVLDVETSGLNQSSDVIIEIALKQFSFHRETGEILQSLKVYSSFQDPGFPLSQEITDITGITDTMVKGQSIDWSTVDSILEDSQLIIAHNAKFDRPFIDKKSKISKDKIWACTLKQINWSSKGYYSSKLELLNIYHGFFTDSHRALNDVEALLYLLTFKDEKNNINYLNELLNNARRPMTQVIASGAPFETKDLLKSRNYSWDTANRFWSKVIFKDESLNEIQWLESQVYAGSFGGLTRDIALTDTFKN